MPPGGGREDPFVLKYLLTITAAAVAETGEVYSGIKPPEYIACTVLIAFSPFCCLQMPLHSLHHVQRMNRGNESKYTSNINDVTQIIT